MMKVTETFIVLGKMSKEFKVENVGDVLHTALRGGSAWIQLTVSFS